jgi:hypothetical protein
VKPEDRPTTRKFPAELEQMHFKILLDVNVGAVDNFFAKIRYEAKCQKWMSLKKGEPMI